MTDQTLEACNCLSPDAFFSSQVIPRNTLYCASFNGYTTAQVMARLRCGWRVSESYGANCIQQCPDPCVQIDHDYSHSFASWPITFNKLHFYEKYVRNTTLDTHGETMDEITRLIETNYTEGMTWLANDHWIEDNFLQLVLADTQTSVLLIEDVPKMTLMNFIALLGGILNLYSGLTIVVLVELLEALIHLMVPCCKSLRDCVRGRQVDSRGGRDENREKRGPAMAWVERHDA